ncbi:chromate transporter [Pseudothauera nasutitermitis]|uniref:Chromate transporter n=1 Tax=Pseudothauera nasutitermitis TaxID=2565930 RepID=A0A4S4B1T2_9RHOO|nr:chromate transporter [Pseudothauera nasutitermitis]THF66521.1 chromate transporter [Pseudothauera nasutitermitis]
MAASPRTGAAFAPRSPLDLFLTFTALALQGFGGVLAIAQRELVERKRWLSREEFIEVYALSQLLPGPNIVTMALLLGDRFFGWRGAAAALAGMLGAPLAIVLVLAAGYVRFAELPAVADALRGMGAVAAGLIAGTAIKLIGGLRGNPLGVAGCAALVLATLVAVAILRVPLPWAVGGLGGLGWWLAWRRLRRAGEGQ